MLTWDWEGPILEIVLFIFFQIDVQFEKVNEIKKVL